MREESCNADERRSERMNADAARHNQLWRDQPLHGSRGRKGARQVQPDLTLFTNRLMDGLDFCKKVYALFEQIRTSPDGAKRLRLRKGKTEKKLIEELIPIARYVQARYSHGRRLRVRWIDGGQQYDARLLSTGALIDKRLVPKRQYIEATTAVHENDHLFRKLINDQGYAFGVKGISLNRSTKQIVSNPHVYVNDEAKSDLAKRILARIQAKKKIEYPKGTVLLIQCFLDTLLLEDEWQDAIARIPRVDHQFDEVFVFDSNHHYSATIYADRRGRRSQQAHPPEAGERAATVARPAATATPSRTGARQRRRWRSGAPSRG